MSTRDYQRARIGFVFQSFFLIPTMTALGAIIFPIVFAQEFLSPSGSRVRWHCWSV